MSEERHTPKSRITKRAMFLMGLVAVATVVLIFVLALNALDAIPS